MQPITYYVEPIRWTVRRTTWLVRSNRGFIQQLASKRQALLTAKESADERHAAGYKITVQIREADGQYRTEYNPDETPLTVDLGSV